MFKNYDDLDENILERLQSEERISDRDILQAKLNIDNLAYQKKINKEQKKILRVGLAYEIAKNRAKHDTEIVDMFNSSYRGIEMPVELLDDVTFADAKHFVETEKHFTPNKLAEISAKAAVGIYDFFIGDDINTLREPKANKFWKSVAGLSLTSNFIGAPVLKGAGKVLIKGTGKYAGKNLLKNAGKFIGKNIAREGAEQTVKHSDDIIKKIADNVVDKKGIELSKNAQKHLNWSKMHESAMKIKNKGIMKIFQQIEKHSNRKGTAFHKLTGSESSKNTKALQKYVEILNNPNLKVNVRIHKDFGKIIDLKTPHGGLRFDIDYNFIGVLEP